VAPYWGKVPLSWVKILRDHPNALAVATCLSAYADVDGVAWPTAETIARETGIRRDRVFAAIARLKHASVITKSEPRHKGGTRHSLCFAVPPDGTAGADSARPLDGTATRAVSDTDEWSTGPLVGTPTNGRSSTGERVAAVPLVRSAIRSGSEQDQSESARTRDDKKENEDGDFDALRSTVNAFRHFLLVEVTFEQHMTLARFLARDSMDCDAHPLLTGQLAEMANDKRYASANVADVVCAARNIRDNTGRRPRSLWELKPILLPVASAS